MAKRSSFWSSYKPDGRALGFLRLPRAEQLRAALRANESIARDQRYRQSARDRAAAEVERIKAELLRIARGDA